MKTTRRLLERVPTDKGQWKPHPKSFSLGHLSQLVDAGWITKAARGEDIDLAHAGGWSLKMGGKALFTQPRLAVVRQNINHLIHHRGQLTVYLRLIDVPIPSIYGPSADEKVF